MTNILENKSVEIFCRNNEVQVSANFEANWREWGKIDFDSITQMNKESILETFERAGLSFTPLSVDVVSTNPTSGKSHVNTEKKAIYNPNFDIPLGIVGIDFNAMSHWDTLESVFGDILVQGYIPTRFLNFSGGTRMLSQFVVPEKYLVAKREHIRYFCVYNAIDGSSRVKIGETIWTPICANTYAMAMSEISSGYSAKHIKNMDKKLFSIAKQILNVKEKTQTYFAQLDEWADKGTNKELADEFVKYLMPKEESSNSNAVNNRRQDLAYSIMTTAKELPQNGLTIYDLFAGVTRYVTERRQKRNEFEQYEYVTNGPGANFNNKAYNWLAQNS